jgi:exosortase A
MHVATIKSDRRSFAAILLLGLVCLGWTYRDGFREIILKWYSDTAFSHGFLILPIALWLVRRKRVELAAVELAPSWLGVMALLACTVVWTVARGSGILVLEQFSIVAMIAALVLAVLGWPATKVLAFPLAFLFFMVPFGRGMVPALMQVTADIATLCLQWSGVPVFRSHMHISIPAGNFEVARACSGLNYFITGLVLGVLYAYISYRTWAKRAICIAAFIVIPIVLNGLRVYVTIFVSHLTDMRFGPGTEHVTFGRIFFVGMMLLLFWIGRRWHDEVPDCASAETTRAAAIPRSALAWVPAAASVGAVLVGPLFLSSSVAQARINLARTELLVHMPLPAAGWHGPANAGERWRPLYRGGLTEQQVTYSDRYGAAVDVFVAVYGLGTSIGAEMISYNNMIDANEHGSLAREVRIQHALPGGHTLVARELVVNDDGTERLVWYWFMVGERPVVSKLAAKGLEALALITRDASSERIVTLSTPQGVGAGERLRAFAEAHAFCIEAGFEGEACGG